MDELLKHPYTILLIRLALGIVFLRSGLGKVFDPKRTRQTVIAYDVLPKSIANLYAAALPWIELILAFLTLVGLWTKITPVMLILLLVSFAIAVTINLLRRKDMNCGCFGGAKKEKLSWRTLARIISLLILAIFLWQWDTGYFSLGMIFAFKSLITTSSPPIIDFLPVLLSALLLIAGTTLINATIEMLREHRQLRKELDELVNNLEPRVQYPIEV